MKKIYLYIIILSIFSCSTQKKNKQKLKIVTTTGMIADLVKNIVGSKIEVKALMGSGVDPHLYKATQGDITKLREADLILYNGLHLEGKMAEVLKKLSKRKKAIALGEKLPKTNLSLIDKNAGVYDPHIWFDINLWQKVLKIASREVIAIDKENEEYYEKNTLSYLDKLKKLHVKVKKELAKIPEERRVLITAHDAFGYFGKAYNIKVKALQGISTLSEFGLRDISELVQYIVNNKIKAVFVESSIPKKSLQAVVEGCKEKNHQINIGGTLFSDAMGNEGTSEGTYLGMVESNLKTIVNGLK